MMAREEYFGKPDTGPAPVDVRETLYYLTIIAWIAVIVILTARAIINMNSAGIAP